MQAKSVVSRKLLTSLILPCRTLGAMARTERLCSSLIVVKPQTKNNQVMPRRPVHQSVQRVPTNLPLGMLAGTSLPPLHNQTISCRLATSSDKEEMVDFLCEMFITREPLMSVLNANIADTRPFVRHHVESAMRDNASFVAVDGSGRICGIRLNAVGPESETDRKLDFGPKMNTLAKFLHHIEGDLAEKLGTKRFMRHIAICVKPDIVQRGVGTMLMQKSVEYARNHSLRYMVAMCSGKLAHKLALKMGFRMIQEVPYGSYVDAESHYSLFPDDCLVNDAIKPFSAVGAKHYSAKLLVRDV